MPTIQFKTLYKKNTGLILSPTELKAIYFYGIKIESTDGTKFNDSVFELGIRQAQQEVETYFGIKIIRQLVTEKQSFYRDDYFNQFPIIPTAYPVNRPLSCVGMINKTQQIVYPEVWLSARDNSSKEFARRISIIPNGTAAATASGDVILSGILSQQGMMGFKNIPDYFTIQYITGFEKMEWDIINLIGMMASIPQLAIAGDLILGAGIASQSLSIDSLSQSLSSTSSATNSGYGARIVEYRKTIKETIERIRIKYSGIRFTTL